MEFSRPDTRVNDAISSIFPSFNKKQQTNHNDSAFFDQDSFKFIKRLLLFLYKMQLQFLLHSLTRFQHDNILGS